MSSNNANDCKSLCNGIITISAKNESPKGFTEMCKQPRRSVPSKCKAVKTCAKPRRKAACGKASRPKVKSRCATRPKCSKQGPITSNGYLNFIRSFRKKHCDMKPRQLIAEAAKAWAALPEHVKDRYRRMACKVTTSERHKRRRVCCN
ncbi:protamine [Drosophila simulans]|uniref:GD21981 n=1 Tax=Drosophila simulans TaxID=7240 RepID=B4Q5X7_DROSI|nr:protamine [Drosophila simulans]EDX05080.1 GD21981 [Drosophila simulans]KMY90305.1 uncharacterized protein Dsimw501_GD21981 [Drosophila simulans]